MHKTGIIYGPIKLIHVTLERKHHINQILLIFSTRFLRRNSRRNTRNPAKKLKIHMVLEGHERRMFLLLVSNTHSRNIVVQWMLVSLVTPNDGSVSSLHVPPGQRERDKKEFKSFHLNLCKTQNLVWPTKKISSFVNLISSQTRHKIKNSNLGNQQEFPLTDRGSSIRLMKTGRKGIKAQEKQHCFLNKHDLGF